MLKIKKLSSDIIVRENDHKYGFEFSFCNGLNIIKGQNSSGKSSVLSCIYYNLGMEQLLGMGTSKSSLLDKCLTSEFTYKEITYTITQSTINLEIENENGQTALLQRIALSPSSEDRNHISITMDGNTKKYFLHSVNDHTDKRGFYTWLQVFLGIELPKEQESSKHTLYLQNIFSGCFIEQTKGWSDFMSQMPSFNIKDARRKLVEYLLSLDCLDNDIEKDRLKSKRASLIEEWDSTQRDFFRVERSLSYIPEGLAKKYEKSRVGYLNKLKLKVMIESEWLDISIATDGVIRELETLRKSNRFHEKRRDATELNGNRKKLKIRLLKLNRVISSLDRAYTTEKEKIRHYNEHLSNLKEEKSSLIGASKVDELLSQLSDSEKCPLCESNISLATLGGHVTKSDYENSLHFIDSKISMIDNYLDSFINYDNEYDKSKRYYMSVLDDVRNQLSDIDKDLNSNIDGASYRAQVRAELIMSSLLEKLKHLDYEFNQFRESLEHCNKNIIDIDIDIKELQSSSFLDDNKVTQFEELFRLYLSKFHYTSNAIHKVKIQKKGFYKAFPCVFSSSANSDQPIRLASSASDFIRAEWAYYLALLQQSKKHPGILIFDEPGQHAMSLYSMISLLKSSEKISNKQLIFTISKLSKGYSENNISYDFTINSLISELTNYNMIEIDSDGEKLISKI